MVPKLSAIPPEEIKIPVPKFALLVLISETERVIVPLLIICPSS